MKNLLIALVTLTSISASAAVNLAGLKVLGVEELKNQVAETQITCSKGSSFIASANIQIGANLVMLAQVKQEAESKGDLEAIAKIEAAQKQLVTISDALDAEFTQACITEGVANKVYKTLQSE
jgi:hypothetical protein